MIFQLGSSIGRSIAKDRITESQHIERVADDRPLISVAPDMTDDRRADFSVADELLKHSQVVVVVPKTISALDVPDRFRVGIPCQKRFGEIPPRPVWEYQQCNDVHLLGGSPLVHSKMADTVSKSRVKSLDTASPIAASSRGKVWGRPFKNTEWYDSPRRSYYERIESSLNNILNYHNDNINTSRLNAIQQRTEIPDEPPVDPLNYLRELPPGRDELCLGGDEEIPFPGREYFYQEDSLTRREWAEKYR